ncbi:MAG: hypothetical protein LN588_02405 [Rickettsia endosymbiont of Bryobia graminum]|nr:hypothetical protein [Rickettsia endosymbiont of Bryobia graminum]
MESADYVTDYFFGNNSCETGLVPYKQVEPVQDIGSSEQSIYDFFV